MGIIVLAILFVSCNDTRADKKQNDKIFLTDWKEKDFIEPESILKKLENIDDRGDQDWVSSWHVR